jgi:hypothetical protein
LRIELACTLEILSELSREEFANDERTRQLDIPAFENLYKGHAARDARNAPLQGLRVEVQAYSSLASQDELRRAAREAVAPWLKWRDELRVNADAESPPS